MRKTLILFLGLAVLAGTGQVQGANAPAKKIQVLLITGDDVTPAHNWRECSQATRDVLVATGKFDVRVCEDAAILESASALKRYDLVFLALYNARTPTLSDLAKQNLLDFVREGKGFAVSHLASASFAEWPEFRELCGRVWVMRRSGHGPRSVFKVRIAQPEDPIMKGIADFETDDELYAKLEGQAAIRVLAEADSNWSHRIEPLVFTRSYGQGRVFHETFGHDGKAVRQESVARIIARGCEWAATGKVEQP